MGGIGRWSALALALLPVLGCAPIASDVASEVDRGVELELRELEARSNASRQLAPAGCGETKPEPVETPSALVSDTPATCSGDRAPHETMRGASLAASLP